MAPLTMRKEVLATMVILVVLLAACEGCNNRNQPSSNRKNTFVSEAGINHTPGPRTVHEKTFLDKVEVGGMLVDLDAIPENLVLEKEIGLLTNRYVAGQVIYRSPEPRARLYETRFIKTPKGDYLLMFPDGGHYASKQRKVNDLVAYRSHDKGQTWHGPTVPIKIDYNLHGFIPLIPRGSSRIYCFGTQPILAGKDTFDGRENAVIGYRYSDDDGYTWSDVHVIKPTNDPGFQGMSIMRMCETDTGAWLIGSHAAKWIYDPEHASRKDGQIIITRQYILRSQDQGKGWVVMPTPRPDGWYVKAYNRMDELRPINLGDGKILAVARTQEGRLWQLRSYDDGKTWTDPEPTPIVHPDAPSMLFHLSDGKTLIVFHHNRQNPKRLHDDWTSRSEIWCSLSHDDGETWSEPRFVFANALAETFMKKDRPDYNRNYQCSYVDMIVDAGQVHIVFPHRWRQVVHIKFKEKAIQDFPVKADIEKLVAE